MDKKNSLYTIDLGTSPPTAYGPFLYGQLGPIGSVVSSFAAAPGRSYGLVTQWDDNKIFRVDFSDPTNPVVTAEIATDKKVEDIAFGPDASWAVCSGGTSSTFLTFVNPTTNTSTFYTVLGGASQSVAVTPDGRTIIVGDNVNKQIIYGPVNSDHTGLTSETVLAGLAGGCNPINISVSPDGRTVLVPCGNITQINVFRVDNGTLVETTPVAGLGGRAQSVAFTPDGSRAFFARTDPAATLDPISWLKVNGPGDVVLGGDAVADGCADSTTSFNYGINTIAVSPDGAFVANSLPSTNVSSTTIPIIDAASFSEVRVTLTTDKPYGMDFLPPTASFMTDQDSGGGCFINTLVP